MSSNQDNIFLFNAFLGLLGTDRKWPRTLADLGFKILWIEFEFKSLAGDIVTPDIVVDSSALKFALLTESKSGGITSESNQMDNYEKVDLENDLKKSIRVNAAVNDFNILILCKEQNVGKIRKTIATKGKSFPVVAIGKDNISLALNKFKNKELNDAFQSSIELDTPYPPPLIKFNEKSSEVEMIDHVFASFLNLSLKSPTYYSALEITRNAFGIFWDAYADDRAKTTMVRKTIQILKVATKYEFQSVFDSITYKNREMRWRMEVHPTRILKRKLIKKFKNRIVHADRSWQRPLLPLEGF